MNPLARERVEAALVAGLGWLVLVWSVGLIVWLAWK